MPVATITAVSPTAGPVAGGTVVTLTGTNFTGATTVNFGATAGTGLVVNSATSITITAPAHAAATVDITVVNGSGTSTTASTDHYTFAPIPVITSVTPAGGSPAGGDAVAIVGSGFTLATAVDFGGTSAAGVTVTDDTHMSCTSPPHAIGQAFVHVTSPGGVSADTGLGIFYYDVSSPASIFHGVTGGGAAALVAKAVG
jgi:hypothetical protein